MISPLKPILTFFGVKDGKIEATALKRIADSLNNLINTYVAWADTVGQDYSISNFIKWLKNSQGEIVATELRMYALKAATLALNMVFAMFASWAISAGMNAFINWMKNAKTHSEQLISTMEDAHDAAEEAQQDVDDIQQKLDDLDQKVKDIGAEKIEDIVDPQEKAKIQEINNLLETQLRLKKQIADDENNKANKAASDVFNDKSEVVVSNETPTSYAEADPNGIGVTVTQSKNVTRTEALREHTARVNELSDAYVKLMSDENATDEERAQAKKNLEDEISLTNDAGTKVSELADMYETDASKYGDVSAEVQECTDSMQGASDALERANNLLNGTTSVENTNLDAFKSKFKDVIEEIDNGYLSMQEAIAQYKDLSPLQVFGSMTGEAIINIDSDTAHQTEAEATALAKLHEIADANNISFEDLIGAFEQLGIVATSNTDDVSNYASQLEATMGVIDDLQSAYKACSTAVEEYNKYGYLSADAAAYDGSAAKTVNITKGNIGLGNVDNTADKNKSVASAAKLTTARTVSGGSDITLSFNYDGSGNSTANIGFYSCKHNVDNTNNYPFHRFARLDVNKGAWVDKSITFLISQDFSGGGYGICRLVYRSNADSGNASVDAQWLVRRGFSADTIQVAIKTDKTNGAYCDAFYKSSGTYMGVVIRAIASGGRATSGRTWTLVDSNEVGGTTATDKKTSSECWKTIADAGTALHKQAYSASAPAKDEGYVASAGSANTSSSCAGNSASATKLTSSAGSATQPVYFKDGKPVAGTYTLGDASSKTVRTLGAVGNTGWANKTTDDKYIPTMSFMAYWNGAYSGTSSNLQYCDRGRFGTIVTKGSGDYAAAGHTHNYAGSGSAGGSANSAVKLDSNAGSSVQPVYFSGGKPVAIGYTISSSVPANAKFTDTTYGVASSSSNGLMSSTDKTKLDDFSRVINIQKQIKLTTDWLDTGIAGNSLDTGTYVVQVSGFNSSHTQLYSEIYSGVMSWYSGTTNSGNSSEIFLHNAGLADNNNAIYLRTLRVAGSKTLKLQIACKVAATGTDTLTFKFRRLI